jgi:hypothetical protein
VVVEVGVYMHAHTHTLSARALSLSLSLYRMFHTQAKNDTRGVRVGVYGQDDRAWLEAFDARV